MINILIFQKVCRNKWKILLAVYLMIHIYLGFQNYQSAIYLKEHFLVCPAGVTIEPEKMDPVLACPPPKLATSDKIQIFITSFVVGGLFLFFSPFYILLVVNMFGLFILEKLYRNHRYLGILILSFPVTLLTLYILLFYFPGQLTRPYVPPPDQSYEAVFGYPTRYITQYQYQYLNPGFQPGDPIYMVDSRENTIKINFINFLFSFLVVFIVVNTVFFGALKLTISKRS